MVREGRSAHLPTESEIEATEPRSIEETLAPARRRPFFHLPIHPLWLGVIFLGGAFGTALRAWLENAFPHGAQQWPWATFLINVTGALILGCLLEFLALSGPDAGWRRLMRLGIGTGVLGGYTTYSTFMVETVNATQAGALLLAMTYSLVSLVVGITAAYTAMRTINWAHSARKKTEVHS